MASTERVDPAAIYATLDHERQARGISWRELARQAGVSASTLSRMAQGSPPSVDGLVQLADWAGCSLDELVGRANRMEADVAAPTAIASYLRSRKELTPEGVEALEAIVQAAYEKLPKRKD